MGLFLSVLIGVLSSIGWLLVLMTSILFAFSHALLVLLRNVPAPSSGNSSTGNLSDSSSSGNFAGNPFTSLDSSLKTVWAFLGGDFAAVDSWDAGRSVDIMRILFSFLTTIVLLNVLIALLNNVFNESRNRAKKTWIRNRAEFIATVEVFMMTARQRQNKNWFPSIVFYEMDAEKFEEYSKLKRERPWPESELGVESPASTSDL
ncbi:hypothetical protein BC936DRAFT_143103 [Jimgerdemannia flammicorona]|uniref:Ion transport domain-containing protein n=1 Tax=Jimgerdemannia flammicorona TaxID=994334 RepID=A0A433DEE4_9FUNG|nr:hypothetical protein BC936DRAFT_143103 [Jimgerdemannia flammicorona]